MKQKMCEFNQWKTSPPFEECKDVLATHHIKIVNQHGTVIELSMCEPHVVDFVRCETSNEQVFRFQMTVTTDKYGKAPQGWPFQK